MYNINTFMVLCHEYYTDHFFWTFFVERKCYILIVFVFVF